MNFYELNWAQGSIEGHVSSIIIATAIINAECSQSFGVIVRRRRRRCRHRNHHHHHHPQRHHPCRNHRHHHNHNHHHHHHHQQQQQRKPNSQKKQTIIIKHAYWIIITLYVSSRTPARTWIHRDRIVVVNEGGEPFTTSQVSGIQIIY